MKFKLTKNKIIGAVLVAAILLVAFWYGGDGPGLQGGELSLEAKEVSTMTPQEEPEASEDLAQVPEDLKDQEVPKEKQEDKVEEIERSDIKVQAIEEEAKQETKEIKETKIIKEKKEAAAKQDQALTQDLPLTVSLSIQCHTLLDNQDKLNPEKLEIIPKDGIIFPKQEVAFYEGENVFNVLQREMKKAKIHMEFVNAPIYNSAYIEGIQNIYEFDCGELSGWVYKVNDWFPNYGASRYQLEAGDEIQWLYTCDYGADVGGHNFERQ